nr:hypothetical protein [Tanacetum cinerariifolium]
DNGTEFVNQMLCEYYEKFVISHETSGSRTPQQNGVVKRCNRMLIEASRTMLIYAKALLFLWVEAITTACYTQNRSIIRLRHGKTTYELLDNKPPDLSFLLVFGSLLYFQWLFTHKEGFWIYNRRTRLIIETIHFRIRTKPSSPTPYVPPSRTDWDILFQPLFDELLNPPPNVDIPSPEVVAPIPEVVAPDRAESTGSPSSTTVDQDAPSSNFDELTTMASEHSSLEPALHEMTPATISSRLVPNPPPSTPYVPPLRSDWDILFQPIFDELLTSLPSVDPPAPEVITLIASINGKKYIIVIVDDSSRFTWVGISHETSVARFSQQNGVIERRNHMLIKAARTMLIYANALLFLWAEAVATTCYTQNRSIIRLRHGKTPYDLLHDKLLDLSFFHVFGALFYPTNDSEN